MKRLWRCLGLLCLLAPALRSQTLQIYCEDDPPNQFVGTDGHLTGMTVEIAREIQRRVGNHDPIQLVPWARGYLKVQTDPDTVLFTMSRTAERNPLFHWVGPVVEQVFSFYAKADSNLTIRSLDEAKNLAVGVYINDVRDTFLTDAGFKNLSRVNNNTQNFKKLMMGRLDVYASSPSQIEDEAKAAEYKASDVKKLFDFLQVQLYIAMSKGTSPRIVTAWTRAFAAMEKDGTFAALHRKYYPADPLPGRAVTAF